MQSEVRFQEEKKVCWKGSLKLNYSNKLILLNDPKQAHGQNLKIGVKLCMYNGIVGLWGVPQGLVVQREDNTSHQINHCPVDSVVCFTNTYLLESDLSGGQRYLPFEQPGPEYLQKLRIFICTFPNFKFQASNSTIQMWNISNKVCNPGIPPWGGIPGGWGLIKSPPPLGRMIRTIWSWKRIYWHQSFTSIVDQSTFDCRCLFADWTCHWQISLPQVEERVWPAKPSCQSGPASPD